MPCSSVSIVNFEQVNTGWVITEQLLISIFCLVRLHNVYESGPILECTGMGAIFQKKGKKRQKVSKFGQKCIKFENILKKAR